MNELDKSLLEKIKLLQVAIVELDNKLLNQINSETSDRWKEELEVLVEDILKQQTINIEKIEDYAKSFNEQYKIFSKQIEALQGKQKSSSLENSNLLDKNNLIEDLVREMLINISNNETLNQTNQEQILEVNLNLSNDISALKEAVKSYKATSDISNLEKEQEFLRDSLNTINNEVYNIKEQFNVIDDFQQSCQDRCEEITKNNNYIESLEKEISKINNRFSIIEEQNASYREKFVQITTNDSSIIKLHDELSNIIDMINSLEQHYVYAHAKIDDIYQCETKIEKLEHKLLQLNNSINQCITNVTDTEISDAIAKFESRVDSHEKFASMQIDTKMIEYKKIVKDLDQASKSTFLYLDDIRNDISAVKNIKIKQLEEQIETLSNIKNYDELNYKLNSLYTQHDNLLRKITHEVKESINVLNEENHKRLSQITFTRILQVVTIIIVILSFLL